MDNGDIFAQDGMTFRVSIEPDSSHGAPWDESGGCGIVRKSHTRHAECVGDKHPGERPMNKPERNDYQFYYDWAGTMSKARSEGWGVSGDKLAALGPSPTSDEITAEAVRLDFERLCDYLADEWGYVTLGITCIETGETGYLSAVESDDDEFITAEVHQMAADMVRTARIDSRFADAMNCGV